MEMLKLLTPEQIKSLSPDQLRAIMDYKPNRLPELKSLFAMITINSNRYINEETINKQKIIQLLNECSNIQFYLIFSIIQAPYPTNYMCISNIYTQDELFEYVNDIDDLSKLLMDSYPLKTNAFDSDSNYKVLQTLASKVQNLHIINPELFKLYAHFNNTVEKVIALLDNKKQS